MPETPTPAGSTPGQTTWRRALRGGLWNYVSNRWAPKNPAGKFLFEIGILVFFVVILAVLMKLSAG